MEEEVKWNKGRGNTNMENRRGNVKRGVECKIQPELTRIREAYMIGKLWNEWCTDKF